MKHPASMTLEEAREQARALRLMAQVHRRHEAIVGQPTGRYDRAVLDVVASEIGDADFITAVRSFEKRVRTRAGALKVLTESRGT